MTNRLAAAAATLSCVLASLAIADSAARAATFAEDASGLPSARVAVADLDLSSQAGVEALNGRIKAAASRVCRTRAVESLPYKAARARCYRTAMADGLRQADRIIALRGDSSIPQTRLAMQNSAVITG